MGIADALQVQENNSAGDSTASLSGLRREFLIVKEGLRHLTKSKLIDCLMSASMIYEEGPGKNQQPTIELYTNLFTQILFPPSRVRDSDDPYSLRVQITVLIDVLAADVWFDFSLVESRIQLGQILWGPPFESDREDDIAVNDEVEHDPGTRKYWLLLQILLSCELLMRLDAISANMDHRIEDPTTTELKRLDKKASTSVRWSLVLERHWLENIRIERTDTGVVSEKKKAPSGWLSSFTTSAVTQEDDAVDNLSNI